MGVSGKCKPPRPKEPGARPRPRTRRRARKAPLLASSRVPSSAKTVPCGRSWIGAFTREPMRWPTESAWFPCLAASATP